MDITLALPPDRGRVVLSGVVGSTAHGLATPDSDQDRLGVFQDTNDNLWGLREFPQTVTQTEPDSTLHELSKFLRLALKCNPTVTELLWLDTYEVATDIGWELVDLCPVFLSTKCVRDAYLGYAISQIKRISGPEWGGRNLKHARHMFRLLEQCASLLETGFLNPKVADPDWYLSVLPAMTIAEVSEEFWRRAQLVKEMRSVLPETPDIQRVNDFLLRARRSKF